MPLYTISLQLLTPTMSFSGSALVYIVLMCLIVNKYQDMVLAD